MPSSEAPGGMGSAVHPFYPGLPLPLGTRRTGLRIRQHVRATIRVLGATDCPGCSEHRWLRLGRARRGVAEVAAVGGVGVLGVERG